MRAAEFLDWFQRKKLIFLRASIIKDILLVAGKIALSIFSASFFMFANALYSAGMGAARYAAYQTHVRSGEARLKSYRRVGIIIFFASACYVLYSVRLFYGGSAGVYSQNMAIAIACYTFGEFGVNIRDALRLRKSAALEAKALRAIGLSSSLLCFVLTQTAIMSFANAGDSGFSDALSGIVFGALAALTGLYVIVDSFC